MDCGPYIGIVLIVAAACLWAGIEIGRRMQRPVRDEDFRLVREYTRQLREQQNDLESAVHQGDRPQPKE